MTMSIFFFALAAFFAAVYVVFRIADSIHSRKYRARFSPHSQPAHRRSFVGRMVAHDISFKYRMGAGSPGDVNRMHPASIEPVLIDKNAPPTAYGQPVVVDATTQGVRPLAAGDTGLTTAYGVTVRPFPLQASAATNYGEALIGAATPPTSGAMDVLRTGYILTQLGGSTAAVKGGAVFIWIAASTGAHVQGAFEAAAGAAGDTIAMPENWTFNGPADPSGVCEISIA